VLPDVDAEDRRLVVRERRVLVRRGDDRERAAVEHEPGPAAAEAVHARLVHLPLERIEAAERALDRIGELAVGLASVRAHDLPEETVIQMAARVVPHGCAFVLRKLIETRDHFLDRSVRPLGALEGRIRLVDVRLVVFVVMDTHRLLVDVRLERRVVVGKRRNLERHGVSFGSQGGTARCYPLI